MPKVDAERRTIVARLQREGWINRGGGSHDVYTHPARPDIRIVVPRHRVLSSGVARHIAKQAGWA
jgi:predicted RNA binding protein YcfA (HicA-like mRNA interferase family)